MVLFKKNLVKYIVIVAIVLAGIVGVINVKGYMQVNKNTKNLQNIEMFAAQMDVQGKGITVTVEDNNLKKQ